MNLDQYRAVTKTELDIADHSDADRPGDNGETIKLFVNDGSGKRRPNGTRYIPSGSVKNQGCKNLYRFLPKVVRF